MATKKRKNRFGFKKHDALRLVGEPMMILGHCAACVVGGMAAKAITIVGAVMVVAWVGVEMVEFANRRRRAANRLCVASS